MLNDREKGLESEKRVGGKEHVRGSKTCRGRVKRVSTIKAT